LVRTAIGPVLLGNQHPGALRPLTRAELSGLHTEIDGRAGSAESEIESPLEDQPSLEPTDARPGSD
jgi:hypothetical protein